MWMATSVKGHSVVPTDGHETCPRADMNVPVGGHETAHRAGSDQRCGAGAGEGLTHPDRITTGLTQGPRDAL